jgi:hypothetical protein
MVKDGNGIVTSFDREPLVHSFLTVGGNHDMHPKLGQLPMGATILKISTRYHSKHSRIKGQVWIMFSGGW